MFSISTTNVCQRFGSCGINIIILNSPMIFDMVKVGMLSSIASTGLYQVNSCSPATTRRIVRRKRDPLSLVSSRFCSCISLAECTYFVQLHPVFDDSVPFSYQTYKERLDNLSSTRKYLYLPGSLALLHLFIFT